MRELPLDIVGWSSFERYPKMSSAATYNMIISDGDLVPYWGYQMVQAIRGAGNSRRLYRSLSNSVMIAVVDQDVFKIDPILGVTLIGTLITSLGPVYMDENNAGQLAIVDGTHLYAYDFNAGTFTIITDGTLATAKPGYVKFFDTYLMVADLDTNEWYLSDNNDITTWPVINTGKLESKNDQLRAVIPLGRQVFVMGKIVTEIWHDVGAPLFPFQRDNTISIPYGVLSTETIACNYGKLVWLGQSDAASTSILISTGGYPEILSSDGINNLLKNLTAPEDSHAFLDQENGHVFYQITFRTDNLTLLYDFDTQKFFNLTDHNQNRHIAYNTVFFNNKNYFVSDEDANLYQYGSQFFTGDGQSIPRIRMTSNIRAANSLQYLINSVSMTVEQGQSYTLESIDMCMSKNGGQSFGSSSRKYLNPLGKYRNILRWWQLGSANDCIFQFRFNFGNAYGGNSHALTNEAPVQVDNGIHGNERVVILNGLVSITQ